jgi:hypothetical protein
MDNSSLQVRALTRVATAETKERLLAVGRAGTACHVERIVRGWRCVDQLAEARETERRQKSRGLHVYQDEDGMVVIRGRLTPEAGAVLIQAVAAARETLYQQARGTDTAGPSEDVPAETSSMAQQQADALALLAETALHHGLDPGTPGERYQVVVHVDAPVLANPDAPGQSVLEGGTHVSAETSRRLACDATRVIMRHDGDGRVVEVGARTRTIPPALRRALHHRDGGCRFPGCGVRFGQGHHIRHWSRGGPTTLSNLAMLCRRHHRAVHEEGYQMERLRDGELHAAFQMTATREAPGTTSLSSSSRFPAVAVAKMLSPVTFPPGRARPATSPLATGSELTGKTMGIVLVASLAARMAGSPPDATITSTSRRTSSAARLGRVSFFPKEDRHSIPMF